MESIRLHKYPKRPRTSMKRNWSRNLTMRKNSFKSSVDIIEKAKTHRPSNHQTLEMIERKKLKEDSNMFNRVEDGEKSQLTKTYLTGSHYEGEWNLYDICGRGLYHCFTGVKHYGFMEEGLNHGKVTLTFPSGSAFEAYFIKGQVFEKEIYYHADGNIYEEQYCINDDRRFYVELSYGLEPAGLSYLTNYRSSRKIPNGFYDVVDGFYDPIKKCVFDYDDLKKVIRIPTRSEHNWILQNCRKAFDEVCGYRPDLYKKTCREYTFGSCCF